MTERVDVAVVGGGVVGLAVARATARRGRSTCVLERRPRPGMESSTHNSGVIHAGIHYPAGSLKARLCVEGREALYRFCARRDVPHARCGKLIVCSDAAEIADLEQIVARGRANGVDDLDLVDRRFVRKREPWVEAAAAVWSPSTGIVDADRLVRTLAADAVRRGAWLLPGTPVEGGAAGRGGVELRTPRERIAARTVVNAAGLYADDLSAMLGGEPFTIHPVRGEYAELAPRARRLINGPVYPLPDRSGLGLGVHFTTTTSGAVTIGPTARHQSAKDDYETGRLPLGVFLEAARRLTPRLAPDDLRPGGAGIRAKAGPPETPFADFIIRCDVRVPALVHAAGIDSPGLTACLAIGRLVSELVEEALG